MADPPVPGFHPYAPGAHSPDCLPSPVSELAQCFTGLGAFETGDTPRRRLDLSNISAEGPDAAVLLESPKHEANTDQSVSLLSPWDSPAPRNSRMKKFRSFLPQLLCSSPKSHSGSQGQQGPPNSNKENVAAWDGQHARSEGRAHISDPYQQGTSEPLALGSPISSAPLSPPLDFLRNKCTDGFMEVVEEQEESSAAAYMSSSMAQLLSDPLMNHEVDLSSVSVCRQGARRLFRSPSMPEQLNRAVLKRAPQSPVTNPPLKRHRTTPVIREEEEDQEGGDPASADGRKRRCLLKTLSLCEVVPQLGGDSVSAELIGDFSKVFALPTVTGRHQDLKYITCDTMCALLNGEFSSLVESFVVVDCRYPYEYQGGHIKGAQNMPNTDEAVAELLRRHLRAHCPNRRLILVFHCEFSSERAPRMCRLLRRDDRRVNEYPALHYPELYILKGGYRDFYLAYKEHCEPQSYCPMHHEDHREELLRFRSHSRASAEERRRLQHVNRLIKL
ncbi:M-phase inducer phosphatase 1-B-like isoform X2 [Scleropages formosus]|nr:M-phase inducer phosphatase 3 isoform X2 [Scleropages formosus]XP_018607162.1 M-phase inducer phosphatase 3 isoform X2 [Scleropages formosus]